MWCFKETQTWRRGIVDCGWRETSKKWLLFLFRGGEWGKMELNVRWNQLRTSLFFSLPGHTQSDSEGVEGIRRFMSGKKGWVEGGGGAMPPFPFTTASGLNNESWARNLQAQRPDILSRSADVGKIPWKVVFRAWRREEGNMRAVGKMTIFSSFFPFSFSFVFFFPLLFPPPVFSEKYRRNKGLLHISFWSPWRDHVPEGVSILRIFQILQN